LYVQLRSTRFHIAQQKAKCSELKDILVNHFTNFAFTVSKIERRSDHKTFSVQETAEFLKTYLFLNKSYEGGIRRGKYFAAFLYAVGTEKGSIISGRSSGNGHRIRHTWRVFPRPTPYSATKRMWLWNRLDVRSTNVQCWFHNVIRSKKYYPEV